jgi:Divergent InlB B-repeat domain/PEP-CTERM motif
MKGGGPKSFRHGGITFAVMMIACGWFAPACCRADVVLLLEQTPVKGGEITPVAGVYHFAPGAEVSLTAVPKPGYQFVHWLGDVSDPTATSTVVYLNKPKVIIAVFKQSEHTLCTDDGGVPMAGGGGGSGGLSPTIVDLGTPSGFGVGESTKPQHFPHFTYVIGNRPAPEVPEPATGVLLLLGGLLALSRRAAHRPN